MEEMKEQRISNKIYGPSTTAGKLDIRETDAQNCMARPPKLVSLLMWPIHQRDVFSQVAEVHLCQDEEFTNYKMFQQFQATQITPSSSTVTLAQSNNPTACFTFKAHNI